MWIMAMFDLPVGDKEQRRYATHFRKFLLSRGFTMLQFSVYAKYCSSRDSANSIISTVKFALPPDGNVRICMFTDKQFADTLVFSGTKLLTSDEKEQPPEQLNLF